MSQPVLLETKNLRKTFEIKGRGTLTAVNGVSLTLHEGETLGLVGESGCGKTTLGRTIVKLYQPDAGQILYQGRDIWQLGRKENLRYRKDVQMIYQDPYASLDPLSVVSTSIAEGLDIHGLYPGKARRERVLELVKEHEDLANNLSVAAHLIHGSSDGRFTITYCTEQVSKEEVEGVNFRWRPYAEAAAEYDPAELKDGWNEKNGERFFYVSNPALGLWKRKEE